MDTAKTVNLLVSEGAEDCFRFVGDGTITRPLKPLVAVLSPEGNGYESSGFAHLAGYTLFSHHLAPHVAVIDDRIASFENPAALLSMVLFALGGAVDAFIGGKKNPLIDAYAGACIHQVVETLKGGRLPGRKDHSSHNALMGAVNLGAGALSNSGKGHLHRLGEVMAACTAIPAGIIMGLLLPSALHHEAEKGNPHLGELLLPAAGFDTYAETAENDRPGRAVTVFAEWVEVLYAENARNLPTSLAEAGLNRNALPMIRDAAVKTGVPPADMEELMELVALACDTPSEAT